MKAALKRIEKLARETAPYLLIVLVMPGGIVFAIFYWLSRRQQNNRAMGITEHRWILDDVVGPVRRLLRIDSTEHRLCSEKKREPAFTLGVSDEQPPAIALQLKSPRN